MTYRNERRPEVNPGAAMSLDGDTAIIPPSTDSRQAPRAAEVDAFQRPCRRCGHLLTAPASLRRGVGPVCVHLELDDERAGGAA